MSEPVKDFEEVGLVIKGQPGEAPLYELDHAVVAFHIGSLLSPSKLIAVNDVSMTLYASRPEIFTLAGESGSGKTTLSRLLLGDLEPTSGQVRFQGRPISKVLKGGGRKRFMSEVQPVFQNPFETFNPLRRVEEYLLDTAVNFGVAKDRKAAVDVVDQALRSVGLSLGEVAKRYPHELSGGQIQRVSVARALIPNPKMIVADEPVSMVDASLRMEIVNLFRKLRDEQGERNWLSKNMTKAGKQAAGTVRALRQQPAELVNGRGRSIWVDGNDYSWIGVVLIDHPDVPADVTTLTSSGDLPVVTLLRGDWEFLFDQLRSVHAVAQYLRRVVDDDDPPPLGQESLRYYQLAQLDEETAPSPMTPALLAMGGRPESVPLLPKTPAGSDDQRAHGLYRVLLEDVATTTLDDEMREPDRLRVLSELDKLEVASRTSLGQHLIAMLEELADEPAQHVKVRHRRFFFGQGRQLCFSVGSRFDEQMQTVFSAWVQLRHHDLQVQTGEIEQSITAAVLLTPRPDGGRRWDTTTVAVHGDLGLTEEQTTTWRQAFDDASSRAEAASGGPADDATS